ncbi:hypothetical protein RVB5_58780 [Pseudomonas aeruginosa]
MGLGPRRVVDNQGKVRSGSAYFPFTVPLAAGTQPRRHGLPARRFVPEKTICADVGLHGMDIHLGEVYAQAPRSDPASAKALRCGQSLLAPLERRIYPVVSPGAIATRRDVPCTQVNPVSGLSTSLEEILRKELLQTLDSVDTGQAGPSPSAPKASHGEHSDTTAWRS